LHFILIFDEGVEFNIYYLEGGIIQVGQIEKLDHIAIAVKDLTEAIDFYQTTLGLPISGVEEIPDQKAKVAFIPLGETNLELVQPTSNDTGLANFVERTGGGLHHICIEVKDIKAALQSYREKGIVLIDKEPRMGAHNKAIAFLHPKSTKGILIELCQHLNK
jgi:methylmalonyl-CoA epimerase